MKWMARYLAALAMAQAWAACLLFVWPRAAQAQQLSDEFFLYDWTSLYYGAILGALGGVAALFVALATDRRPVRDVFGEALRNLLISPLGGIAAYLIINALSSQGWLTLNRDLRFCVMIACGWGGIGFFLFLGEVAVSLRGKLIELAPGWFLHFLPRRWRHPGAGEKERESVL